MLKNNPFNVFWFRRDLRLDDNAALYHALKSGLPVQAIFIFDSNILSKLEDKADKRVSFLHATLSRIKSQLQTLGSDLWVFYGDPQQVYTELYAQFSIANVFTNHDYEPYAQTRDAQIKAICESHSHDLITFKDQCIFEKNEVLKDDGKPYTVFTPYSRKWKAKLNAFYLSSYPNALYFHQFRKKDQDHTLISLETMGFTQANVAFEIPQIEDALIEEYAAKRDIPSIRGTSRLSMHLRFGTVSIRIYARRAQTLSETWLNELIWRDFYMMILWHFPHITQGSFKKEYDRIAWRNDPVEFEAWCTGQTGYPIVDAGMRELNTTGFMHNRVRMIVASFLTKHLLIDWRWGEAYFAQKLLDYDLSANNGGWQWAAGSGCDAAPYFRVFNPALQTQKFDSQGIYIRHWVPEFQSFSYPKPIVVHEFARNRAIATYSASLKGN